MHCHKPKEMQCVTDTSSKRAMGWNQFSPLVPICVKRNGMPKGCRVKRNGAPPRKRPRIERAQPPLPKRPYDMSDEETAKVVMADVAKLWTRKMPEIPFEKTLDPVKVVRTVENLNVQPLTQMENPKAWYYFLLGDEVSGI